MGTEVVNYDAAFAAAAASQAKQDRGSDGTFLSTRGGILALGEEQLPGNQVACVIIDSVLENAYYPTAFDPNNKLPPTCFAFSRGEPDEMFPHLESMSKDQTFFMPQNMDAQGNIGGCSGCPMAEWGSQMRNGQPGRGKACKNQYRLALLPAGLYQQSANRRDWELGLHDDPQHYDAADIVFLKLPVTSGAIFERYRKMLRLQHARPTFGAFTRIFVTPDPKNQFTVNFELIELLPNEIAGSVLSRNSMLEAEPFKGYEAPGEDNAPQQTQGATTGRFGGAGMRRR